MTQTITVYGADWCEDTQRSMRHLRRLAVPYEYLNVDDDPDALERAKAMNGGKRRTPTIDLSGRVLVEPTNAALTDALVDAQVVTREQVGERLAVQNVGDLERVLRVGGGLFLLAAAHASPRGLRWPLRLAGVTMAFTGLSGWCPAYARAGVTSLDGPGDRPAEAARRAWTRPVAEIAR